MPDWKQYVRKHLPPLQLPPEREAEIVAELAQHLEAAYEEALARGALEAEARAAAQRQFTDWPLLESELHRAERTIPPAVTRRLGRWNDRIKTQQKGVGKMLADLWQDIHFGLRQLRKNKGFTTVAVLTLALGIGANTAIFSVANAVLLRPLPYAESDRLFVAWETQKDGAVREQRLSYPNFMDWKKRNTAFEKLAVFSDNTDTLSTPNGAERHAVARVSADFLPALGVQMTLGRTFLPEDDLRGAAPVVILSYGFWQSRFGGDPSTVGQTLTLDGQVSEIVGVLPSGFDFPLEISGADIWTPMAKDAHYFPQRGMHGYAGLARLKAGITLKQAQSDLNRITSQLAGQFPDSNKGRGGHLVLLHKQVVGNSRLALQILLGVVGFVLLIACANVANLLLTRGSSRAKELAIRGVLGAGRGRLIRQLLIESLLLGAAGGVGGFLLAYWGRSILQNTLSVLDIPRLAEVSLDFQTVVFVAGVSLLTAAIFGAVSAIHSTGIDLTEALKTGGRTAAGSSGRLLRNALVVAEMALALVLFIGAGLMIRSFYSLVNVHPGFETSNTLSARILVPAQKHSTDDELAEIYRNILDQLAGLPGVKSAGASTTIPLVGGTWETSFWILGRMDPETDKGIFFRYYNATPDYFPTMGIPLRRGRLFTEEDRRGRPGVAVINETMAEQHWPNGNPIGERLKMGIRFGQEGEPEEFEIIGVVGDVKHSNLDSTVMPQIYIPYRQQTNSAMQIAIRTEGDPGELFPAVRAKMAAIDRDIPLYRVITLEQARQRSAGSRRSAMLLLGSFAGLAVVLAGVGLYGVISYTVNQRVHEIGIRMALGAPRHHILKLVLGQGMLLAIIGVGLGLIGAAALTRVLESFLFSVSATDPVIFALVAALLLAIALLACWIPARRAMRVDPMVALRHE
ncbi:MAG: ABC transporter permease [Candidatus Acidoferrales bacterium]